MENLNEESSGKFLNFGYYEHFYLKEECESLSYIPENEILYEQSEDKKGLDYDEQ